MNDDGTMPLDGFGRCPCCGENYSAVAGLYHCPECPAQEDLADDLQGDTDRDGGSTTNAEHGV